MGSPPELDLGLVGTIITRAGAQSTSFIEVFKAYNDVLHGCGLDPADDVVYYRFILKLGSIPGANWGERWARWLSDAQDLPTTSEAPSSPILLDANASVRSLSPPLRHSTPLARRRPPRATTASPALHEPSPRRLHHTTLLLTSPPPPPDSPPVPRERASSVQPVHKRVVSQSRAAIEEELRREDEERARQREDERRADVFYEIGLMGRCWDVWRKGREWVKTTAAQIDRARAFLLLGSTLAHWRKVLCKHRSLALLASQVAARSLLTESVQTWFAAHRSRQDTWAHVVDFERRATEGKTWLRWRTKWDDRRRARWEHSLAKRQASVQDRLEHRMKEEFFDRWRGASLGRVAVAHYQRELLTASFQRWRALRTHKKRLNLLLQNWVEEAEEAILRAALEAWRAKARRQAAEAIVVAVVARRVKQETLDTWQQAARDSALAKDFRRRSLLKVGFAVVKQHVDRRASLTELARRHSKAQDGKLLRTVIDTWCAALERREAALAAADDLNAIRLQQSFLAEWRAKLKRHVKEEAMAGVAADYILKRRAFGFWVQKRDRQRQAAWVKGRQQALLRASFTDWRARLVRLREQQEAARRERERLDKLRSYFVAWSDRLKEARLRDLEETLAALHARNTLDAALARWELRATVATGIHFDKVRVKRAAWLKMQEAFPRVRDRNKADRVARQRVLSETYERWQAKTRAKLAAKPLPRLKGISRARPRLSGGFADASRRVR